MRSRLQFFIENRVIAVQVGGRAPVDSAGVRCEGLYRHGARRVDLSPTLDPRDRYRVMVHELVHAWRTDRPRPRNDEEEARDIAAMVDTVTEQLDQQGGRAALESLRPMTAEATESSLTITDRVECGHCQAQTMCGSVANGPLRESPAGPWRERVFECDVCGGVNAWAEYCDSDGQPLGKYRSEPAPRVLRGQAARQVIGQLADRPTTGA